MKKLYTTLLLLWTFASVTAQYVAVSPNFPGTDNEITLTFDLKLSKDSRTAGLLGKTDLYLWAWGGSDSERKKADLGPSGQSSFNAAYTPGKLTSLGNDRWEIKLTPRKYLNAVGKAITWMGCLVKNTSGSSQTEDFTFALYDGKLSVSIVQPSSKNIFADANSILPIIAVASAKVDLKLIVDGASLFSLTNTDSLKFNLKVDWVAGISKTIKITAKNNTETTVDSIIVQTKPTPKIANLAAGFKDGINYISDTQVVLSLYAPQKNFVHVVGDFNNWTANNASLMNRSVDGKRFWIEINNLISGKEYAFQYVVDGTIYTADPYCEKILDPNNDQYISDNSYPNLIPFPKQGKGTVSVLETGRKSYPWKVTDFKRPAQQDLVIYELLVRDFVETQNYKTLADTLPYLKKLGINAIELMPIMEFTGNDSWGYNPIFYLAPDKAYGTREDLKAFIDKCHQNGIAVILDMVLNHADYEFPYVKMYWDASANRPAEDSPFFNTQAPHLYSVFFDFNHESKDTQTLIDRINQHWLQEYRFDGYRYDLSKGFTQTKSTTDAQMSAYDAVRIANLKRMYDKVRAYDKTAYMILEHFAENQEEIELSNYGMMLWGNLNYEFRNGVNGNASNFDWLNYKNRNWTNPNVVGYMESHDEQRLMYDALTNGYNSGGYNVKALATAANREKAAAAIFFNVPGPKMIWQFGELGYDISIDQNGRVGKKPIKWIYLEDADRLKLNKVYAELIKLKTTNQAFKTLAVTTDLSKRFKKIFMNDASNKVLVVANLDVQDQTLFAFPYTGKWYDYFTGKEVNITDATEKQLFKAGEFHIYTSVKLPTPEANLVPWGAYQKDVVTANEPIVEHQILVFPNPTQEFIVIDFEDTYFGEIQLKINDLTGRNIQAESFFKRQESLQHRTEINHLPTGTYQIVIEEGEKKVRRTVVKF